MTKSYRIIIVCTGVITLWQAVTSRANNMCNYEGIREIAPTVSAKKSYKSSVSQTTAKIKFVPFVDLMLEEARKNQHLI